MGIAISGMWGSRQIHMGTLRVALFSGNYNMVRDGANRALNRLGGHILESGGALRVYSPTVPSPAFDPTGDLISVPSIAFPGRPEYRLARGLPDGLKRDIRQFKPDIIHVSAPDPLGFSAQHFARELGVPIVASLHTRFETYLQHYGLGFVNRLLLRKLDQFYDRADLVLVPTDPILQDFAARGFKRSLGVWGRGIDSNCFCSSFRDSDFRKSLGYREDEIVPLFFGRLVREKGVYQFADVITRLRQAGFGCRPMVIGDGPERSKLARLLPNVNFLGHLSGPELGCAVASADILINPSQSEAFGNVNLEAMASGLAVVSADVPSASQLIDHGRTGLLVTPDDLDAYVAAVLQLADDVELSKAVRAAAIQASEQHRWPEILDGVLDAYRVVLSGL